MHRLVIVRKYYQKILDILKVGWISSNGPSFFQNCLALFRRASCHIAKQQYDQAKGDLDNLLVVDPENSDAKVGGLIEMKINEMNLFIKESRQDNADGGSQGEKCPYTYHWRWQRRWRGGTTTTTTTTSCKLHNGIFLIESMINSSLHQWRFQS